MKGLTETTMKDLEETKKQLSAGGRKPLPSHFGPKIRRKDTTNKKKPPVGRFWIINPPNSEAHKICFERKLHWNKTSITILVRFKYFIFFTEVTYCSQNDVQRSENGVWCSCFCSCRSALRQNGVFLFWFDSYFPPANIVSRLALELKRWRRERERMKVVKPIWRSVN